MDVMISCGEVQCSTVASLLHFTEIYCTPAVKCLCVVRACWVVALLLLLLLVSSDLSEHRLVSFINHLSMCRNSLFC